MMREKSVTYIESAGSATSDQRKYGLAYMEKRLSGIRWNGFADSFFLSTLKFVQGKVHF
jgi:hypothetical protein